MADRTIKPDDTHDLVLQNNDGSSKLELNEDQTVKVSTGSSAGDDFTVNTTQLVVEGDTGNVGLGTGNLVIGTAGKGIDFSITSDATGTSATDEAEILKEYEEGYWYMGVYFSTSAAASGPSGQKSYYVRTGQSVTINGKHINPTGIGALTGNASIIDYPFAAKTTHLLPWFCESGMFSTPQIWVKIRDSTWPLQLPCTTHGAPPGGFPINVTDTKFSTVTYQSSGFISGTYICVDAS